MKFFSQSRDVLAWIGAISAAITGGKYAAVGLQYLYNAALTQVGVAAILTSIVPLLIIIAVGVWRK